jgi:anaphase-promoting complex subunit 6
LTAIGFTYHLQGEFNKAIDYYHRSLGLNPRDPFTFDMLERALREVFEENRVE